jgi:hypothetical protein
MNRRTDAWTDRASDSAVIILSNNLIILFQLQPLTKINLPYRLAQLRESGVQFRIRQHFLPSTQPDTEPSSINSSLVTVAPIFLLLAAGNVLGLLILMIEQIFHICIFRNRSAGINRCPHNKDYRPRGHV